MNLLKHIEDKELIFLINIKNISMNLLKHSEYKELIYRSLVIKNKYK
jgi:hypothetical protein